MIIRNAMIRRLLNLEEVLKQRLWLRISRKEAHGTWIDTEMGVCTCIFAGLYFRPPGNRERIDVVYKMGYV
jgi:hypothetical protein